MILTKNLYNPDEYEHLGHYFDVAVFTSSFQSDLAVLTTSFKPGNLEEYEAMMMHHYGLLYEKTKRKLEAEGMDGLFNLQFTTEVLYPGAFMFYITGDKVKRR